MSATKGSNKKRGSETLEKRLRVEDDFDADLSELVSK